MLGPVWLLTAALAAAPAAGPEAGVPVLWRAAGGELRLRLNDDLLALYGVAFRLPKTPVDSREPAFALFPIADRGGLDLEVDERGDRGHPRRGGDRARLAQDHPPLRHESRGRAAIPAGAPAGRTRAGRCARAAAARGRAAHARHRGGAAVPRAHRGPDRDRGARGPARGAGARRQDRGRAAARHAHRRGARRAAADRQVRRSQLPWRAASRGR
ncbi:MAG: hypothetical protein RML12_06190 [Xanthomonadales bacterium]|nr:hypothetical protein [Xanthomonadales bacterium]